MAKVSQARMYSWWWDSHISPKNSRWLQENLTDMDSKVKSMIKLIEEDADSFARRAEMYYKKRPELMKLVEEFYRAYRALAERYDNATGVLKQAHRTMTEAFPNQNPMMMADELPEIAASEMDPRTPEMSHPIRGLLEPDDLQKDALGLSSSQFRAAKNNGAYTEESDSIPNRRSVRQLNNMFGSGQNGSGKMGEGRVQRGLSFHEAEVKGRSIQKKDRDSSEVVSKFEKEIQTLKETLLKLEAEKEAGLAQYQESLERLSKLESEVSRAQEDSKGLNERANKADDEVRTLKEALAKHEAEKEATLLQYQQNVEKIANLEKAFSLAKEDMGESNEQARQAKTEAEALKQDLARLDSEKDAALVKHQQSLEMIATLENKLLLADEHAKKLGEIAEKAETEVETLKKALAKLMEEKEAACLQYEQCLATISSLEDKLSSTQEEAQRLQVEIDSGAAKLKVAEEQRLVLERSNQSLHSELESLVMKSGAQSEEITEKQKELGRLWTCIQEERLRFIEAETAFQTLQHLHNQTQEELRSMASELQNRTQLLRDFESHNQSLQDEVEKIKEANKGLTEINISSSMSIKDMQTEIFSLRESKGKLEDEVELRVDQRNALQQEIYCLKEELNELNKKHNAILCQIEGIGLNPDSFGSSVRELQEENLKIKEAYEKERGEKVALLEKLETMEQLLEKNALLEISLKDLSAELEGAREKIHALEDSFEALLEEKSILVTEKATLITQLQETTEKLEKLSEKNTFLENSLLDAHDELEGLKRRSKTLEDSCQLLENEKSSLINEKDTLDSQVEITQQSLNELEMRYRDLEEKFSCLEKVRDTALYEVESLRTSLDVEKEEHERMAQRNEKLLATMKSEMHLLRDEGCRTRTDLEEELDRSVDYQLEIFILRRYMQDLKENSASQLVEFQKLLEASALSEELISELRNENAKQQVEVKTLSDETSKLRMGMHDLLIAFGIDVDRGCDDDKIGLDQTYVKHMLTKLGDTKSSLRENVDKSQQLEVEISVLVTLLDQLRKEAAAIAMDKAGLDQKLLEASTLSEQLISELRNENVKQQVEIKTLSDETSNLRMGMHDLFIAFGIDVDRGRDDDKIGLDQTYVKHMLTKLGSFLRENVDKSQQLEVEISVLVTLLDQLRKEAAVIAMDKAGLDQELRVKNEEISMLLIKANKLQEMTEELKLQVKEKDQKETSQQNEIENLRDVLLDVQGDVQKLQKVKSMLLEEKGTLTKELLALEGHTQNLEEENLSLVGETLSLSYLSLLFENILIDKSVKLKEHGENLENLHCVNGLLEEKLRVMLGKMEEAQLENMQLKELLSNSEDEIASIKDFLNQKENALSEAEQKVATLEDTQSDLQRIVEDLKREHDEAKVIRDVQERQILKLSEDNNDISNESGCLRETNNELNTELQKLHEEHEKAKKREQSLSAELQSGNSEIDLLESEAIALFGQLQISVVFQALLEEKVRELAEACKSLGDEAESKGVNINLLKDTIITLEGENGGHKAKLGTYALALNSLDDCMASLEDHLGLHKTLQKSNQEVKDAEVSSHLPAETYEQSSEEQADHKGSGDLPDLQDLQTRLEAIENAVIEAERVGKEEAADVKAKLEAATKEIEELKLKASMNQVNVKRGSEISESEEGILTKDIMLDQVSECSSYGINRRENFGSWDTADLGGSFGHADVHGKITDNLKHGNPEMHVEKELNVGKLEISKTFSGPRREVNRTKILQRLNSDVQKLTNLQITVQDLKKKVATTAKSKNARAIAERENMKSQLDEAEEAILKLFDVNGKLSKGIEESPFSDDAKPAMGLEERENLRRRRLSEQARRVSEKIGRLQLEIQKLQFVLLKFDSENEKERSRVAETSRRVLLRDYLYGAVRTGNKKKKRAPFCACVRPPTKGD